MTTLHLPIDRSTGVPIHRQVYDGFRRAILDGLLRPGQRVPSTRALAVDLAVSRLPVLTAYDHLLHEGYLDGRVGSGTFVSSAVPDDLLRSPGAPAATVRQGTARQVPGPHPPASGENGLGPFRISLPALDQFPHAVWDRLVARHTRALTAQQMAYGHPAGLLPLRAAIAEHLRAARAVRCEAEQVLIVSGSQAALRLATAVLLSRGDRLAVEEPGYPGARAALGAGGAELVSVPVDEEGMNVDSLRRRGRRVRAAYVTPSHQYPLGTSMTAARRFALLDWAFRRDAWVLEDDYDSEYRYVSRPLGALQGMDAHQRVIYMGSFSKVLFPAVRVGYVVAPPTLRQRFVDAREAFDLFPPSLYQLVLAEFLREGHFARHLRRMRGVYLERRDALLTGLDRHCGDRLTVHNADAGLHLAVLLSAGLNDGDVVQRMAGRGLAATALSTCYAGTVRRNGLLLGFGGSPPRRMLDATRVLGEVLQARRSRSVAGGATPGR
ncbi:MAG: PLP-dependent aminotransferase family protein [Gemmatimonadales bacterium]|nr:PLP-dependent aminotransferase family protein [Gemmatimonadales bacterium]